MILFLLNIAQNNAYITYEMQGTLLVIKMDFFFWDPILIRIAFSLAHFITLEQGNDYVMILEYQGEINICKILLYVT